MGIDIHTGPGCVECADTQEFLTSHAVAFEERDIRKHPEYLRILTEETDGRATPTLVLG